MPDVNCFTLSEAIEKTLHELMLAFNESWLITTDTGSATFCTEKAVAYKLSGTYTSSCFDLEKHEFLEICICIDGNFNLQIGDENISLSEGSVCVILPDVAHRELPGQACYAAAWMSVNKSRAVVHLSGKDEMMPFTIVDMHVFKPGFEYLSVFDNIRMELEKRDDYYIEMSKAYIIKSLISVHRELKSASGNANTDNWKESIANEIISYIKSKYNSHIRLDEAAQLVCISPNYLNTIFKSITGKTIIQYHEDYRIDMAKSILSNMNNKINDISAELGYYDQYHFSKIFKKATGMTPSEYRKQSNN